MLCRQPIAEVVIDRLLACIRNRIALPQHRRLPAHLTVRPFALEEGISKRNHPQPITVRVDRS
jgi:hypothetical protein